MSMVEAKWSPVIVMQHYEHGGTKDNFQNGLEVQIWFPVIVLQHYEHGRGKRTLYTRPQRHMRPVIVLLHYEGGIPKMSQSVENGVQS